jgi:carbonic anhydrase
VVVCGHYGCGGIKAALSQESFGQLDEWLLNIRNIYKNHQNQLDAITDEKEKADKLVELNVKTQVKHIATTLVYQHTWNKADGPTILGWVFNLETGLLEQLTEVNEPAEAESLV